MEIIFIVLLAASFVLAVRSMRDFRFPRELERMIRERKIRGSIIFFKKKIKHYRA